MRVTILNHEGDVLLVTKDEKVTEETKNEKTVKETSTEDMVKEFNKMMDSGHIAIDNETNKIINRLMPNNQDVIILNPQTRG